MLHGAAFDVSRELGFSRNPLPDRISVLAAFTARNVCLTGALAKPTQFTPTPPYAWGDLVDT
jgi:hypothetical protein